MTIQHGGHDVHPFFSDAPVTDWASAKQADTRRYGGFFRAMLEGGVYLPPSQFEAAFLSTAHGEEEIERTIEAARKALRVEFKDLTTVTEDTEKATEKT